MKLYEEDLKLISNYDAQAFAFWCKSGLADWSDSKRIQHAFAPLSSLFSPSDEIEPQLIDFAQVLPSALQASFFESLAVIQKEAREDSDEALLYSVEYVLGIARYRKLVSE